MKSIGLYITDEYLYLTSNGIIYSEQIPSNIVIYGRINDSNKFLKVFNKIIKKNKIGDSIIGKTLNIIKLPNYLKSDLELLTSIFEKSVFRKINFINYSDITDNKTLINITKTFTIVSINKDNSYVFENKLFLDNTKIVELFLKNKPTNCIFICGQIEVIKEKFIKYEKKYNLKIYIFNNSQNYIIDKIAKITAQ